MYSRFIKVLKFVQILGYIASVLVAASYFSYFRLLIISNNLLLIIPFLFAAILCLVNYITTQTVIVVIDLLSRIEINTRNSRQN